jgi:hypothetical protein
MLREQSIKNSCCQRTTALDVSEPNVFAEGLRERLPSGEPAGASLPWRLPRGRPAVEEMEGAATLPPIPERQREAAGTMPPQPGEAQGQRNSTKNRLCGSREGHPHRFFVRSPSRRPANIGRSSRLSTLPQKIRGRKSLLRDEWQLKRKLRLEENGTLLIPCSDVGLKPLAG